jgi:hypothetical protein
VRNLHVVFTLPSELRALGRRYSREIFGALLSAASETLLELGQSRLRARLGITMVLHSRAAAPSVRACARPRHVMARDAALFPWSIEMGAKPVLKKSAQSSRGSRLRGGIHPRTRIDA